MARLKRCDLCGAEADELMSIDFPYEERWMLFFHKKSLAHYADLCLDCLEKIRAERQAQIKANEVDFEIADTPQTETKGVGYCNECKWFGDKQVCGRCRSRNLFCEAEPQPRCPNCGKRGYIRSLESMGVKLKVFDEYRWKCTNCNKYFKEEPKDEPQTDLSEEEFVEGMKNLKMEVKQTDCGWK